MKREMFQPYKEFLLQIIRRIETKDQVNICIKMADNFVNCFRGNYTPFELNDANNELMEAIQMKQNSDTII
jgi:hypothetical protein